MPSLSLIVLANDLDPVRVSNAIGLRPSQYWRKGEKKHFVSKNGKTIWFQSTHKWGGWKFHFPSPKTDRSLIRKMTAVAASLNRRKTRLRTLSKNSHEIYLVSLIQDMSSIVIPPELHRQLGGLGIHLQIDFLPSEHE